MLHFYDVEGVLVRRWVPAQRRLAMEGWMGDGWAPYPNADNVSRHGHRLTEDAALSMLHASRQRAAGLPPLSDQEARSALVARSRRA